LARGEKGVEQDFLRDDADRAFGVARVLLNVEAPYFGAAARLHHQPGENVDQCRLARAVGAEQPEDLSARNVEADFVERALGLGFPGLIGLAQFGDADRGFGRAVHGDSHSDARAGAKAGLVNEAFTLLIILFFQLTLVGMAYAPRGPNSRSAERRV